MQIYDCRKVVTSKISDNLLSAVFPVDSLNIPSTCHDGNIIDVLKIFLIAGIFHKNKGKGTISVISSLLSSIIFFYFPQR